MEARKAKKQDTGQRREGERTYLLPCAVAAIPDLSPGAKILYSVLRFRAGNTDFAEVCIRTLKKYMREDSAIPSQIRRLERTGLVETVRGRGYKRYYLTTVYRRGEFIRILPDILERHDLTFIQKLLLCGLSYWQGNNKWYRTKLKDIAQSLGLTLRTARVNIERLRANGLIQVRPSLNNSNKGNKYAVTLARENVEQPETAQRQEAKQRRRRKRAYRLPCKIALIPNLSSVAKILYGVLNSKAGDSDFADIDGRMLANCMGVCKDTILNQVRKLVSADLVRVMQTRGLTQYYLMALDKRGPGSGGRFIPILDNVLERRDLTLAQKLLLCSLYYYQSDNEWCCWKQKDIARALGLSLATVRQGIRRLRAKGLI